MDFKYMAVSIQVLTLHMILHVSHQLSKEGLNFYQSELKRYQNSKKRSCSLLMFALYSVRI